VLQCVAVGICHYLLQLRAEVHGVCCSVVQGVLCRALQCVAVRMCHHLF